MYSPHCRIAGREIVGNMERNVFRGFVFLGGTTFATYYCFPGMPLQVCGFLCARLIIRSFSGYHAEGYHALTFLSGYHAAGYRALAFLTRLPRRGLPRPRQVLPGYHAVGYHALTVHIRLPRPYTSYIISTTFRSIIEHPRLHQLRSPNWAYPARIYPSP